MDAARVISNMPIYYPPTPVYFTPGALNSCHRRVHYPLIKRWSDAVLASRGKHVPPPDSFLSPRNRKMRGNSRRLSVAFTPQGTPDKVPRAAQFTVFMRYQPLHTTPHHTTPHHRIFQRSPFWSEMVFHFVLFFDRSLIFILDYA